jgi:hypothetical protein
MPNIKTKLIEEIGVRSSLRVYWKGECPNNPINPTYHNAEAVVHLSNDIGDFISGGELPDYDNANWPTQCDYCGCEVPDDADRQLHRQRIFNTPSGSPEPGDIYYASFHHGEYKKNYCRWDNCDDPRGHVIVVLPNKHTWDLDGRARNCTMKEDRTHRCWVRHGDIEHLTVDKNGFTCAAGAGSILAGQQPNEYHGFLVGGELREC